MRIYISAPWETRELMHYWARQIREKIPGAQVVSSWHEDEPPGLGDTEIAARDLADLARADTLLFALYPKRVIHNERWNRGGGGRHTEFGIAYERGMDLYLIGEDNETVFHSLVADSHRFFQLGDFIDFHRRKHAEKQESQEA